MFSCDLNTLTIILLYFQVSAFQSVIKLQLSKGAPSAVAGTCWPLKDNSLPGKCQSWTGFLSLPPALFFPGAFPPCTICPQCWPGHSCAITVESLMFLAQRYSCSDEVFSSFSTLQIIPPALEGQDDETPASQSSIQHVSSCCFLAVVTPQKHLYGGTQTLHLGAKNSIGSFSWLYLLSVHKLCAFFFLTKQTFRYFFFTSHCNSDVTFSVCISIVD